MSNSLTIPGFKIHNWIFSETEVVLAGLLCGSTGPHAVFVRDGR